MSRTEHSIAEEPNTICPALNMRRRGEIRWFSITHNCHFFPMKGTGPFRELLRTILVVSPLGCEERAARIVSWSALLTARTPRSRVSFCLATPGKRLSVNPGRTEGSRQHRCLEALCELNSALRHAPADGRLSMRTWGGASSDNRAKGHAFRMLSADRSRRRSSRGPSGSWRRAWF
jgi:hypothetical protein